MDSIYIKGLEIFARHGVHPEENRLGQKFIVDVVAYTPTSPAAYDDDLNKSVSYSDMARAINEFAVAHTYKLIETLAENIAHMLLMDFDLKSVKVDVKKPWAPVGLPLESVGVSIERAWHTAYIAVGSNIGDRQEHIDNAIDALNDTDGIRVTRVSSFITTEPYGNVEQEDFLNGCLEIETVLSPDELLMELHRIEKEEGRERLIHWGPRTLDLDIIFYDDIKMWTDNLIIPHVDMHNRSFVLEPLSEIAPYYVHPVLIKSVLQLKNELEN